MKTVDSIYFPITQDLLDDANSYATEDGFLHKFDRIYFGISTISRLLKAFAEFEKGLEKI